MAKIIGAKEFRAALRIAGPALRQEATKAVTASTEAMHDDVQGELNSVGTRIPFWHGKVGMQDITGRFRRFYRRAYRRQGMRGEVGMLTAAAMRRAFYARFFFYGTSNQPARPVHDEAFEREEEVFIGRQRLALRRALQKARL